MDFISIEEVLRNNFPHKEEISQLELSWLLLDLFKKGI